MDPNNISRLPTAQAVFATAAKRFYDELPEEDKRQFQAFEDPREMIASVEQHIKSLNSGRTSRLLEACKKIEQFSLAMKPFFEITNIFVSSHPDWAAIAWGAIRLVFQLSSHFVGFFEKLADMFDEFRRELPAYYKRVEIIRERIEGTTSLKISDGVWQKTYETLFQALSHVYVDILQFCHDACRLFSKKRRGIRYKAAVIWDLFWTPFDVRFLEILGRLKRHKDDFDNGLSDVYSMEMMQHFNAVDDERRQNAEQREVFSRQREVEERRVIDSKMESLQKWIAASNWTSPFEAAKEARLHNTGLWILEQPEYKAWEAQLGSTLQSHWERNILVITAKPGYGKTILSTRIIEHLKENILREGQAPDYASSSPCLSFFYFDQQRADNYSHVTALQAIAAQLLFSQRNNKTFVDIGTLLMRSESQGQMVASEQSLVSLIRLFLDHLDGSFIVLEALDECAEWERCLGFLRGCTEQTNCKIVITSRPHLGLSSIIGKNYLRMNLQHGANQQAIYSVLRPAITTLIEFGGFGQRFVLAMNEPVIDSLVKRADSIILWAVLMVKYLQSPYLSPRERAAIIDDEQPFKGLEKLYSRIVQDILGRVPQNQHRKIHKVFEWLVVAQQPWTAKMMWVALAVQMNRRSTPADFMDHFDESFIQLCGPLVEIRRDRSVRFTHLSVAEYLTNPEDITTKSPFSVDLGAAHCSTATVCLAYLLNEVAHQPLSGNASTKAHQQSVLSNYCFLPYVMSFWPIHAAQSLQRDAEDDPQRPSSGRSTSRDLIQLLSVLTTNKVLVTTWIEACWTFGITPTLLEVSDLILEHAGTLHPRYRKQLTSLGETLRRLSTNLSVLNKNWGKILAVEPNEIWLPSVNAFTDSEFWIGTDAAKVDILSSTEDQRSKAVVSQVSSDGKEVDVIRVWPSKKEKVPNPILCNTEASRGLDLEENWTVAYQIWSLETTQMITSLRFEMPSAAILQANPDTSIDLTDQERKFRFPVALSPSLRTVLIMGVVIRISETVSQDQSFLQQELFDPRCPYTPVETIILRKEDLHSPLYPQSLLKPCPASPSNTTSRSHPCHNWLRSFFSPCEKYLLVIKGHCAPSRDMFGAWILDVYLNLEPGLNYGLIAKSGIRLNAFVAHSMLFHPNKSVVVLVLMAITVMWRLTVPGDPFITIFNYPLDHIGFSNCGNVLHGVRIGNPGKGEPVFLHVGQHLADIPQQIDDGSYQCGSTVARRSENQALIRKNEKHFQEMQMSSVPEFSRHQAQLQVSALVQENDRGAVMLQTMRADGKMIEETITRLPKSSTLEKSFSTLVPADSHENLRLVLNMAIQDTYEADGETHFQLPAVLERVKSSVPKVVYTPQKLLGADERNGRKRLLDSGFQYERLESREMKKRK